MRHSFSLTDLWEGVGRHCPCFPYTGALQENPTLSLLSLRISPVRGEYQEKEDGYRGLSPQRSCSPHETLCSQSQKLGWRVETASCSCTSSFLPKAGGSRFPAPCPPAASLWKWMILPSFQIPKWDGGTLDPGISKRFLGIQPLEDELVLLGCVAPVSLHRQDPTSLWHRAPSSAPIYSVFQSRVVQQLNCCWPLQTEQRLPTGAHAAPWGSCDLWSYLR